MPLWLIDSTDACLDKFYIMAFTSGRKNAGSDGRHTVEIRAHGYVRKLRLYNRPGNDYAKHKGDLWKLRISSFHFPFSCLTIRKIQKVSIIESSDDGWNIDSIVTLVGSRGRFKVLTQNLDVNHWINGNGHLTHKRFTLTFA